MCPKGRFDTRAQGRMLQAMCLTSSLCESVEVIDIPLSHAPKSQACKTEVTIPYLSLNPTSETSVTYPRSILLWRTLHRRLQTMRCDYPQCNEIKHIINAAPRYPPSLPFSGFFPSISRSISPAHLHSLRNSNHLPIRILQHNNITRDPLPRVHVRHGCHIQWIRPTQHPPESSALIPRERKKGKEEGDKGDSLDTHLLHPTPPQHAIEIRLLGEHHRVRGCFGADGDGD
jgi:hypothetical protein